MSSDVFEEGRENGDVEAHVRSHEKEFKNNQGAKSVDDFSPAISSQDAVWTWSRNSCK